MRQHNAVDEAEIKKGYTRIKEKIRANKAVINGTRSGSGRVVQEYYDKLSEIWKGSPVTEKLKCGIAASSQANDSEDNVPSVASCCGGIYDSCSGSGVGTATNGGMDELLVDNGGETDTNTEDSHFSGNGLLSVTYVKCY